MKRANLYVMALCVAAVLASISVAPVSAQDSDVPQTIQDANELAQYQLHLLDQEQPTALMAEQEGAIANRNELAAYQAKIAGSVGVAPEYQWNQWYVKYTQICDCQELADYMNHLVDINVSPNAL